MAAQPPHPLQPRLGRSRRQARGPSARSYVWWDEAQQQVDRATTCPDFIADRPPVLPAQPETRTGLDDHRRRSIRSSCRRTARAGCSRPAGCMDGPLPTHYEPQESVVQNPLYGQQCNPARHGVAPPRQPVSPRVRRSALPVRAHDLPADRAPHRRRHVRWLPWLAELQPEMFCEVSPELAAERGLDNGGWATHHARARGEIEAACW